MAIQLPQSTFGKSEALGSAYSDLITLTDTPGDKTMTGCTCELIPPITGVPKSFTVDLIIQFRKNTAVAENFLIGELQISNDLGENWITCTEFSDLGYMSASTATADPIRLLGFYNLAVDFDLSMQQDFIFRLHTAGANAANIEIRGLQPVLVLQNIAWDEFPL